MNCVSRQMVRAERRAEREFRSYMDIWDDGDLFLNELFGLQPYDNVSEDM
ncbi:hypothetical protein ALC57_18510 [Trachymyrmex cornetzi]|uniref:Uncharacterized protein n=1 Tax=Trachymyrmex cornetzi TaxID=471704 RepID=A0A151IRL9_9HYME|nr:hypothetical protein ALC57_18510 [Trachymyrmex cornetzi]